VYLKLERKLNVRKTTGHCNKAQEQGAFILKTKQLRLHQYQLHCFWPPTMARFRLLFMQGKSEKRKAFQQIMRQKVATVSDKKKCRKNSGRQAGRLAKKKET